MTNDYAYGMDDIIKAAKTITVDSERNADEVFAHAQAIHPLPTAYKVRAEIRCNQLDTIRMVACDWHSRIETRKERVQGMARAQLREHLTHAHPYLGADQAAFLVRVIQFNFRDIGR